jgi:hypothetical protein
MKSRSEVIEKYRLKWGIPDWRDEKAYPKKLTDMDWHWEFLRRREDYRKDWDVCADKIEIYERLISNYGSTKGPQKELLAEILNLGCGIDAVFRRYGFPNGIPIHPAAATPEMLILEPPDEADIKDLGFPNNRVTPGSLYRISDKYCGFFYDLDKPINAQIRKAQSMLLKAQREKPARISGKRLHRDNFIDYLRVYDARCEHASFQRIGKVLRPDLMYSEAAARMEECYKAAKRLMIDFPQH